MILIVESFLALGVIGVILGLIVESRRQKLNYLVGCPCVICAYQDGGAVNG